MKCLSHFIEAFLFFVFNVILLASTNRVNHLAVNSLNKRESETKLNFTNLFRKSKDSVLEEAYKIKAKEAIKKKLSKRLAILDEIESLRTQRAKLEKKKSQTFNLTSNKLHGSLSISLPYTDDRFVNETYKFEIVNNYDIKSSNISQYINDQRISKNRVLMTDEELEIYKVKLDNKFHKEVKKEIGSSLHKVLEEHYKKEFNSNFTRLINENLKEEIEQKKKQEEIERKHHFNELMKKKIKHNDKKVKEMLKKLDSLKIELKKERQVNNELLSSLNEKKIFIKTKERELFKKIGQVKEEYQLLKEQKMKTNTKKLEDLENNLELLRVQDLDEKIEKEKKLINDEIDRNNQLYEENQKKIKEMQEKIKYSEVFIVNKTEELVVMEKEMKHKILNKSLDYVDSDLRDYKSPLLDQVKSLDSKILFDKLQIDLNIEELTKIKSQLEYEKVKEDDSYIKVQEQIDNEKKKYDAKFEEEAKLMKEETSLREEIHKLDEELTRKEAYLRDLQNKLAKIAEEIKKKASLVCPFEVDIDNEDTTDIDYLIDRSKFKSKMNKTTLLNFLYSSLLEDEANYDSIEDVLKEKEKELNDKEHEMKIIETRFLGLVTYNKNKTLINNKKLRETYEKYSKLGKIKERIKKIFDRLEEFRKIEIELRKRKKEIEELRQKLKDDLISKNKYFKDEETKIAREFERIAAESVTQKKLNEILDFYRKNLTQSKTELEKEIELLIANNTAYNKLGYINITTYNDLYSQILDEERRVRKKKEKLSQEKDEFIDSLKDLLKQLGNNTGDRRKFFNHHKEYDYKTKLFMEKQLELLKLKAKLKNLTIEDERLKLEIEDKKKQIETKQDYNAHRLQQLQEYIDFEEDSIKKERNSINAKMSTIRNNTFKVMNKLRRLQNRIKAFEKEIEILLQKQEQTLMKSNQIEEKGHSQINKLKTTLKIINEKEDFLAKQLERQLARNLTLVTEKSMLDDWNTSIWKLIRKYKLEPYLMGNNFEREKLECVNFFKSSINGKQVGSFLKSKYECDKIDTSYYMEIAPKMVLDEKLLDIEGEKCKDSTKFYILVRFIIKRTEIYIVCVSEGLLNIMWRTYIKPSILKDYLGSEFDLKLIRRVVLNDLMLAYLYKPLGKAIKFIHDSHGDVTYTIAFTVVDALYDGSTGEDDRMFQGSLLNLESYDSRFRDHIELKYINFRDIYETTSTEEILCNMEQYKGILEPDNTLKIKDLEMITQDHKNFVWPNGIKAKSVKSDESESSDGNHDDNRDEKFSAAAMAKEQLNNIGDYGEDPTKSKKSSISESEKDASRKTSIKTRKSKLLPIFTQIASHEVVSKEISYNKTNTPSSLPSQCKGKIINYDSCKTSIRELYYTKQMKNVHILATNLNYTDLIKKFSSLRDTLGLKEELTSISDLEKEVKYLCEIKLEIVSKEVNFCSDMVLFTLNLTTRGGISNHNITKYFKSFNLKNQKSPKSFRRKTFSQSYVTILPTMKSNYLDVVLLLVFLFTLMCFLSCRKAFGNFLTSIFYKKEKSKLTNEQLNILWRRDPIRKSLYETEDSYLKLAYAKIIKPNWKTLNEALESKEFNEALMNDRYLLNLYNQVKLNEINKKICYLIYALSFFLLFITLVFTKHLLFAYFAFAAFWLLAFTTFLSLSLLCIFIYRNFEEECKTDYLQLFGTIDDSILERN